MGQRVARVRRERAPRTMRYRLGRARHRWFLWRNYTDHWWTRAWRRVWVSGTFRRRFWLVFITAAVIYVILDAGAAWLT